MKTSLAFTALLASKVKSDCPSSGYALHNGHLYKTVIVISGAISWTNAKAAAELLTVCGVQGHLVTITSASENTFVEGLANDCNSLDRSNDRAWIGHTDELTEGTWICITGEDCSYTNWATGEPNNAGGQDYAVINHSSGGDWDDCQNTCPNTVKMYVVEFDISDTTIEIDGCDTGVNNLVLDETEVTETCVSEFVSTCVGDSKNHGQFVKCIKNKVYDAPVSCNKAGDIMSCAGGASFFKRRLM